MKAFLPKGWKRPVITSDNKNPLKSFRQDIATTALAEMERRGEKLVEDGRVAIMLTFALSRPKSAKSAKRKYPTVKPDLDKLVRAVLDALTGIVFRDDAQVCAVICQKTYDDPERTEIKVGEL